jgi:hypothetical protein
MFKFLRKYTAIPAVKYSLIAIASLLWFVGFADQLPDNVNRGISASLLMAVAAWRDVDLLAAFRDSVTIRGVRRQDSAAKSQALPGSLAPVPRGRYSLLRYKRERGRRILLHQTIWPV